LNDNQKGAIIAATTLGAKTDPEAPGSAAAIIPAIAPFRQKSAYLIKGGLHQLMQSIRKAAESFGAEIISDRTIRKIAVTDGVIQSVIMSDETEHAADHYVVDHDPVSFFGQFLEGYSPPPAFLNRVKPESNIKNCVSIKVAVSDTVDLDTAIIAPNANYVTTALKDMKADGGSQFPILSLVNVSKGSDYLAPEGHTTLDVIAQYFVHDLEHQDPILKAVNQALVKAYPALEGAIVDMSLSSVATQCGLPTFMGTMPLLPLLKIFGGYHSMAYDCPMDNVLIAGYGEGSVGHHHVHDGGERIAFLYDSFKENDKKAS
jgi:phytoene dehydrogenase-like protein